MPISEYKINHVPNHNREFNSVNDVKCFKKKQKKTLEIWQEKLCSDYLEF